MENTNASVTLLLDTRREKKDETYPVKLSVYFEGEKKRYKTGISLSEAQWEKLFKSNLRDDDLKLLRRKLNLKKEKAEKVIESLQPFTYREFEEMFFQEKQVRKSSNLKELFDDYIQALEAKGRVGSASLYKTTINSLLGFKSNLKMSDITTKFLEEYEEHLLAKPISGKEKAKSPTTVGIYLRHLRAIVNVAIERKLMKQDQYPFKGFEIPSSRNIKKALQAEQLKKLLAYRSSNEEVQRSLDFWIFSYISNGMNFTDICQLKPLDIKGEFFTFYRSKTKHTKKRDLRPIKVPLTERTKQIIAKWRNKEANGTYLFPILTDALTAWQQKYKIQDFIAKVNKHMNEVAIELGIEGKLGTYVARHSHSTMLKRLGVSTEMIRENLGHSSVLTTANYLDDFEDDLKINYANRLIDL
ncbi:MAG: hypothetical protein EOP48_17655 [Sphingobacteriales bacterium]|nr:MAG: hypothetical protein EOP48_17655 [Sphingobacteriales bacterium]